MISAAAIPTTCKTMPAPKPASPPDASIGVQEICAMTPIANTALRGSRRSSKGIVMLPRIATLLTAK